MATSEKASGIKGDKPYQIKAREILPILVRQAKLKEPIRYGDLAQEVNIHHRNLNYSLGSIGRELKEARKRSGQDIPSIQCLVVNKNTSYPGEGIGGFMEKGFAELSEKKKQESSEDYLQEIFRYDNWDAVLSSLELQPALIPEPDWSRVSPGGKAGGEGPQHKTLKDYIKNHPDVVGINFGVKSETEKKLPSGDSVDVSFTNKKHWIGVEVKSEISNEDDIRRGLFQCVKYKAVMEAMIKVYSSPEQCEKDVKVILALGGCLPASLVCVKNALGIEVKPNIADGKVIPGR